MSQQSRSRLAADAKSTALKLGADFAGIASAAKPDEADQLVPWLQAGMHGDMGYMETRAALRREIRSWYPEARSVVVCAFNYAQNAPEPSKPGFAKVSRYARLPDYHDELKSRLTQWLAWFKEAAGPGADGRVFVDSSPVLERAYARLAGLGWIGKNTMLLNKKHGSYFFLAGVAVNVDLPPDEPDDQNHCGSCRACLDVCPTDAFPKERQLDGSRCISYLTIENRGSVPQPLRRGVGEWAFGCDLCQEVCPWNRFAEPGAAFPPAGDAYLDLEATAALDEAAFRAKYRGSPLWRAKRRGLVRNALLAMGNSADRRHAPTLERYCDDADPVLSEQARWSLARCRPD